MAQLSGFIRNGQCHGPLDIFIKAINNIQSGAVFCSTVDHFVHYVSYFCFLPRSMVCSEGSVGMPQNMMLVNIVQSSREKQQDTRCTRVKVLQGGRLMTENHMCPSWKSFAVFMKNKLLKIFTEKVHVNFGEMANFCWRIIRVVCCERLYYLNLFKSVSVATEKTLSRLHSPTSTASQELQRKCHLWPPSRSCTITLLTYLHWSTKV